MDPLSALAAAQDEGRTAVLVTVIAIEGDPPSYAGAKIVVVDGQVRAGTLGCSEHDTAGVEAAAEVIATAEGATLRQRAVFGPDREQVLELFAERHDPPPAVFVGGDNAVAARVAELVEFLGRRVVRVHTDAVDRFTARPPTPADAVVLCDHDAPYVEAMLTAALAGPAYFVGMLGSRRHAPMVMRRLLDSGVPAAQVERLHSPCGLDIGSRGPAEIALSIVAAIVATERGRSGGEMQLNVPA